MYFSVSSPNSTSTLRVHMENLDCKQSAQSWVSFLVHLLFYITMDDLKHLINKEIFKIYYHTMYLKLMFVRLKWYHLGNWHWFNYPWHKGENVQRKALVFSETKWAMHVWFLFLCASAKGLLATAWPQSWPGTGDGMGPACWEWAPGTL